MDNIESVHQKIAQKIKNAKCIVITAGAGMGIDSNLPDYRGKDGFWKQYIPFTDKFTFIECANPKFLKDHPNLFWGFYGHRMHLYRDTKPHDGFQILKKWCEGKNYHVITSNVDGHFTQAGFNDQKVYEIHGSIHYFQCTKCRQIYSSESYNVKVDIKTFSAEDPLPTCKNCDDQIVRPNILMFEDYSFMPNRVNKQIQLYNQFTDSINQDDEIVVLEFGAGTAIPTIRQIGEKFLNFYKNVYLVRVNPYEDGQPSNWNDSKNTENKQYISLKEGALSSIQQINSFI